MVNSKPASAADVVRRMIFLRVGIRGGVDASRQNAPVRSRLTWQRSVATWAATVVTQPVRSGAVRVFRAVTLVQVRVSLRFPAAATAFWSGL